MSPQHTATNQPIDCCIGIEPNLIKNEMQPLVKIHIAVSQPSIMDSRGSSAYYEGVASTVANHSSKETGGYHAPAPRQEQSHAQASPGPALVAQALSGNRDM